MKALVYTAPESLEIRDVPKPVPKEGELLLQIMACGICGSDVHGYLGKNGRRTAPMVMGHEFTAKVVGLGDGCQSFEIGDAVSVFPCLACFDCELCEAGRENLCQGKKVLGVFANNGAMQEFIALHERQCFRLPDGVDYLRGALAEAFAVGYAAAKKAGDLGGKKVLIIGAGTIGILTMLAVKARGPAKIAMSDLSDKRLEVAKKMGASDAINPKAGDFDKQVASVFGGKADVVIEAVGTSIAANHAVSATASGGKCIWIGNNHQMIEVNMQEIVTREISVLGSFIYSYQEFNEALAMFGNLNLDVFLDKVVTLDEAAKIFAELAADNEKYLKCIINMEVADDV